MRRIAAIKSKLVPVSAAQAARRFISSVSLPQKKYKIQSLQVLHYIALFKTESNHETAHGMKAVHGVDSA